MLQNEALVCHYCGSAQAERTGVPGKKIQRCPNCMSYLYDKDRGCQACGFTKRRTRRNGALITIFLVSLLVVFILWQFGVFPGIPYGGKAIALIVGEQTPMKKRVSESPPAAAIIPLKSMTEETTDPQVQATEEAAAVETQSGADASAQDALDITMTPSKAPAVCNGITTRIGKGLQGEIYPGGVSSNLRENPSTEGPSLGVLKPGMTFMVESDEAVCALGYLWIKVRINETGEAGWTVEAKGDQYWLMPAGEE